MCNGVLCFWSCYFQSEDKQGNEKSENANASSKKKEIFSEIRIQAHSNYSRYCMHQYLELMIEVKIQVLYFVILVFFLFKLGKGSKRKKMWIYPHFGGLVGQDGVKIHKKNMPLKSILDHFQSFQTNFFLPFLGGWWVRPGQAALESDFFVTSLRI